MHNSVRNENKKERRKSFNKGNKAIYFKAQKKNQIFNIYVNNLTKKNIISESWMMQNKCCTKTKSREMEADNRERVKKITAMGKKEKKLFCGDDGKKADIGKCIESVIYMATNQRTIMQYTWISFTYTHTRGQFAIPFVLNIFPFGKLGTTTTTVADAIDTIAVATVYCHI